MKKISLLGSTGSIGVQAVEVIRELNSIEPVKLTALAAHSNINLLESQIREFKPQAVAVFDLQSALDLRVRVADTGTRVLQGIDGLCEVAGILGTDIVLNAVTGMIGLKPTLAAIESCGSIAIANKETLVTGGELVMRKAAEKGVPIIPVDSEHSAIFQCLQGMNRREELKRVIITASGGPFFGSSLEELESVTPQMALRHPNWDMGAKITVDSATMMNKGLEIIEAKWLFDIDPEEIDVVVHRESIIHSLIEYVDNSVIAQMGVPDMRIPIQYAITYPKRYPSPVKQLNLADFGSMSFFNADESTFTCLASCKEALKRGGLAPAAVNGADEEAVKLFLNGKISFTDIGDLVKEAMERQTVTGNVTLESILEADKTAREYVITNS